MRAATIVVFLREGSPPPAKMCHSSLIYMHNFDSCVAMGIHDVSWRLSRSSLEK